MGLISKQMLATVASLLVANAAAAYYRWPDSYSAMSDIDWSKRSYDNWISPAYGYHSMADSDWGWKKRGAPSVPENDVGLAQDEDEGEEEEQGNARPVASTVLSRFYNQQQAARYPSYLYRPYISTVRRSPKIGRDRAFAYHSMADSDWGWKKRSAPSGGEMEKRHIGSIGAKFRPKQLIN